MSCEPPTDASGALTKVLLVDDIRFPEAARLIQEDQDAYNALRELQELLRNKGLQVLPTRPGPAAIMPQLLLGGISDAHKVEELKSLGVTHVLNLAGGEVMTGPEVYEDLGIAYSEIVCKDTQDYDIMQHFEEVAELADAAAVATPPGRLFVHCYAGVNRSGTLCIAYHAVRTGTPLLQSARYCKERRGRICTNAGFQLQLFDFACKRQLALS